jgi:hypothetical protein
VRRGRALTFSVDYPDRSLNRLTTAFRIFTAILVIPVALMLLFRRKYPRWWFDWNLQLTRFNNRIAVYFAPMDDRYPSTDEEQAVHLDFPYPDAEHDLRAPAATRPSACRPNARRRQGGPKLGPSLGCSSGHHRRKDQGVCGTGLASSEGSEMD